MLLGWEFLTEEDRDNIARGIEDGVAYGGPYHLGLFLVDHCNYSCYFCNQAFLHAKKSVPIEEVERIIMQARAGGLRSVQLAGGGESLMYPKMRELLALLDRENIKLCNVVTNGLLLREEFAERFVSIGCTDVAFSINEIDPELYAQTHVTRARNLQRVLDNMKYLAKKRDEAGLRQPICTALFSLTRKNYRQVEWCYNAALKHGADQVVIRDLWGIPEEDRLTPMECEELQDTLRRLEERDGPDGALRYFISFENIPEFKMGAAPLQKHFNGYQTGPRHEYCYIGWYSMTLHGSGKVFPCCFLQTVPGITGMGNVLEQSVEDIWYGPFYRNIRHQLRSIALKRGNDKNIGEYENLYGGCQMRNQCMIGSNLCDDDFYRDVDRRLDSQRRSARSMLTRFRAMVGSQ